MSQENENAKLNLDEDKIASFSRGAKLLEIFSLSGIHGLTAIRVLFHVVTVYENLAKSEGSDNVSVADFQQALADDPATGEVLSYIQNWLPMILSILGLLFNFPIPSKSAE